MKLLRVGPVGEERPAAMLADGSLVDLSPVTADLDGAFLAADGLQRVQAALDRGDLEALPAGGARVGAPVTRPGKVVCVGLNYRDHAAETGAELPAEPVLFLKDPGTVVGPDDPVLVPRGSSKTDYEVELAVVIGRRVRYLAAPEEADARVPEHSHPHEQLGMVVDGELVLTIDGVPHRLRPGGAYQIPGGVPHAAWTDGVTCRVLDVFQPVREDYREKAGRS